MFASPVPKAAVARFELSTDVLSFDTHINALTPGDLAKRGRASGYWLSCATALTVMKRRRRPARSTLVRDGGPWGPQLELDLGASGCCRLISLPFGDKAAEEALQTAAWRGAMRSPLSGKVADAQAAQMLTAVCELDLAH